MNAGHFATASVCSAVRGWDFRLGLGTTLLLNETHARWPLLTAPGRLQISEIVSRPVLSEPGVRRAIRRSIPGNPWVIIGQRRNDCLTKLDNYWQPIRAKARLEDVRLHDLRHTCVSLPD